MNVLPFITILGYVVYLILFIYISYISRIPILKKFYILFSLLVISTVVLASLKPFLSVETVGIVIYPGNYTFIYNGTTTTVPSTYQMPVLSPTPYGSTALMVGILSILISSMILLTLVPKLLLK
ncbi:MAG: hypothetical protein QW575_06855 [Thermoproteota archaeon]